jgi:hypothetical protein
MKRIKLTKDFYLDEFIPKDIYFQFGKNSIWFLDQRIVSLAQFIRDRFGHPVTINNWIHGGSFNESALRSPLTQTGAKFSQHKSGRAFDAKIESISPLEFLSDIRENFADYQAKGATTIELNTPTWSHIDVRWTGLPTLHEVPYQ